ncbi:MAG TPA: hypothetical protein VFS31_12785, partial [Chitinophagaceae bacterium]|nr:hypothetical protein [Chitinophagaceae bacterium]
MILASPGSYSQSLNWYLAAHAGANDYRATTMSGSLLAGFENESGNQIAAGPVLKTFMVNGILRNRIGARLYS